MARRLNGQTRLNQQRIALITARLLTGILGLALTLLIHAIELIDDGVEQYQPNTNQSLDRLDFPEPMRQLQNFD